ncbi:hypothetical protein HRbin27_01858 [bacterium HR27]|nr:hypothetical protein HRbin27_01858 [bacterium HR27]
MVKANRLVMLVSDSNPTIFSTVVRSRSITMLATNGNKPSARSALSTGPASAIAASRRGGSGPCSMRVKPPIGSKVMSRTARP